MPNTRPTGSFWSAVFLVNVQFRGGFSRPGFIFIMIAMKCRNPESSLMMEQNVSLSIPGTASVVAAEILIGNITLRLYNGADEHLIQSTLRSIGGLNNA